MRRNWLVFFGSVVLQILLLAAILVPRASILTHGKTVMLDTLPYDPYSILRGYYVNLRYRISDPQNLPGGKVYQEHHDYYIALTPNGMGVWEPVAVYEKLPRHLKTDQAVILGKYRYGSLDYGIGQYYLPETQRQHVEELLRNTGNRVLVETKVGADGRAALVKLIVGSERFEY